MLSDDNFTDIDFNDNISSSDESDESDESNESDELDESNELDKKNIYKKMEDISIKYNYHNDKLNELYGMVKELLCQNKLLINKVSKLEKKLNNITIENKLGEKLKNLCEEDIILDDKFVLDVLIFRSPETILKIIRKHYENNGEINYPFRCLGKQKFEYYNNKWIEDTYANNIVNIIFNNIKKLLKKVNIMGKVSMNNFIENQRFIYELDNDKYKRKFVNYLRSELLRQ